MGGKRSGDVKPPPPPPRGILQWIRRIPMPSSTSILTFTLPILIYLTSFTSQQSITACNGYPELCDRGFHQVATVTTHNSFAIGESPACNQRNSIVTQLKDGVRGLMLDTYKLDPQNHVFGDIQLCHTSCALMNAGSLLDTLKDIKKWMDANRNEVITIMLDNVGNFPAKEVVVPFDKSGLLPMIYTKPSFSEPWPTLRQMIQANKRIVVNMSQNVDYKAVPWLLKFDDMSWQNPYFVSLSDPWSCARMPSPPLKVAENQALSVINHFIYTTFAISGTAVPIPNPTTAERVNGLDSLGGHINACKNLGVRMNYVTVDFYEYGNVFSIVAGINGVKYTGKPTRSWARKRLDTSSVAWVVLVAIGSVLVML